MALKDWKKIKEHEWIYGTKHGIIFKSKKEYPVNHLILLWPEYTRNGWYFEDNKSMNTRKWFKSKSQALKFAKSYMRKH